MNQRLSFGVSGKEWGIAGLWKGNERDRPVPKAATGSVLVGIRTPVLTFLGSESMPCIPRREPGKAKGGLWGQCGCEQPERWGWGRGRVGEREEGRGRGREDGKKGKEEKEEGSKKRSRNSNSVRNPKRSRSFPPTPYTMEAPLPSP